MVHIAADVFVLAAGAVENARMLLMLLLHSETSGLIGAGHRWIGRCFMEHPRDTAMTLTPGGVDVIRHAGFYDAFTSSDGTTVIGRVAFEDGPPCGTDLPNMSISLLPVERETGRFRVLWRRVLHERSVTAYGWSQQADPAAQIERFRLVVNLEQRPDPSNRVTLGSERDSLGQLRPTLHWRWGPSAQAQLERLREVVARAFEDAHVGQVTWQPGQPPDPNAHHHSGTTRMAADSEHGVVDVDARVFGCDNLYVTGASVMPTAGVANPALTIVALAARLAEHLRTRL
jgi:choline dehydrogenase-like flavoprotein